MNGGIIAYDTSMPLTMPARISGKPRLTRRDLAVAETQLVDMVLRAVLVAPPMARGRSSGRARGSDSVSR